MTLSPFSTADTAFDVTFSHAGPVAGHVSLEPDNFREDNTRYLADNVGKALSVVLVSDADDTDWHSAAFYIGHALAPSPQAAPGINLVRRRSQDLDRGLLETADVFCLATPATLSGGGAGSHRPPRAGRGPADFVPGWPHGPGIVVAGVESAAGIGAHCDHSGGRPGDFGHAKKTGGTGGRRFSALRFRRHWQNCPPDNRAPETWLAYADGSAALTLSPAGRGLMVLVDLPTAAGRRRFCRQPDFSALLHELLRLLRQDPDANQVLAGMACTLDVPTAGEGALTVTDPAGNPVAVQVLSSGRNTRLALPPARIPGVYTVKQAETVVANAAVNVDPRESDTRPLALENLKPGANAPLTIQSGEYGRSARRALQPVDRYHVGRERREPRDHHYELSGRDAADGLCRLHGCGHGWNASLPLLRPELGGDPARGDVLERLLGLGVESPIGGQGTYDVEFQVADSASHTATTAIEFAIAGSNAFLAGIFPSSATGTGAGISIFHHRVDALTTGLPVDVSPSAPIYSGYQSATVKAFFGNAASGGLPNGIPAIQVPYDEPDVPVSTTQYQSYYTLGPIPPYAPVEATANNDGDRHVLVYVEAGGGKGPALYEMWQGISINSGASWTDSSNALWPDVTSNALTTQGNGTSDAAGLPVAPLLVNADEVIGTGTPSAPNGVVHHPIRFTVNHMLNYWVWPATETAGTGSCSGLPTGNMLSQSSPPSSCTMTGPAGEIL